MRSVLNIDFSTVVPSQDGTIPLGLYANGAPFLIPKTGTLSSFSIVCLKNRIETSLSPTIIQEDTDKNALFYNATHDLLVPFGNYYYKLIIGGSTLYSQVFRIDKHMRLPNPLVGDFNQDFNNDFFNFEASGIIDEWGEEA